MSNAHTNWSSNLVYSAKEILSPKSKEELQQAVASAQRVKAFGSRHCFNDIADTDGVHISTEGLNRILSLDPDAQTVTIEGGVRYGKLGAYLHEQGWALPNLASLPHISVVGACATATHGSGNGNGNLATSVVGIEFVTANGELKSYSKEKDPEIFDGLVVNLGALGIVSELTLAIEPSFQVRQDLYENLPLEALRDNFETISSSAYSVSLFTDWQADRFHQVWQKRKVTPELDGFSPDPEFFGATLASENHHPLPGHESINCTQQLGQARPWHERLPHFRLEFTPSSGAELQSEYFVAREHAYDALAALFEIREQIAPIVFVSEVRTMTADSLWLSMNYQRESVGFHFTWQPELSAVMALLPKIEEILEPFVARPHWGKLFSTHANKLSKLYPNFGDFKNLIAKHDPTGKFRNKYLEQLQLI